MGQNSTHLFFRLKGLMLLLLFPALMQAQQVMVTVTGTGTCAGLNNGTATANPSGGWAPYTYLWSTGATTKTITGLAPGTYSVTATDIDLGFAVGTITIGASNLGVQVYGSSQICENVPDGTATAVPFGGAPPYTYLWSNGAVTPQITNLVAGTYTVTVTDAAGCTAAGSFVVGFWDEGIWIMTSGTNVTCFGQNNGTAHVSVMSGTPPYSYIWSTGSTAQDIVNLAPGTYGVTVSDVFGCSNFGTVTITQPPALVCTPSSTPANCGLAGSASISATGGTAPYTVNWSNGLSSNSISAMPGTYSVTVTDANGCSCTSSVTVTSSGSSLTVNTTILTNAGCNVGGSASATVSAGGSGTYAYAWDNGQTTATATNLTAGNHKVTVTDITTGCTGIGMVNIPGAPQLTVTAVVNTNANCLVGGSATASASGGTGPYTYKWDNNQTTATATSLSAGPHTVTVTDATGCIGTANVNIVQTQGPTVSVTVNSNATCTTGGSATAVATGGSGGYIYLWSVNAITTATAANLPPGVHKVTVTDAGGCASTAMVTITQPNAPTAVISGSSPAGCGSATGSATVGAMGGSGSYTYKWNNPGMSTTATVTNLTPGTYTVTVTDANGCTATASVSIASSLPPTVVISASTNAKCDQPGSATASVSGGTGPYTYLWDTGSTTATATNLNAGVHTVTVTGADGCTATASVTIGFTPNGVKIGDYVWYDNDQDGFQHPLETAGVPNVSVMLIKAGNDGIFGTPDDMTVQTTTTNASGLYFFNCVTPGTYVIMFSGIPAGYEFTDPNSVANDCKDSDAKANGKTDPFTIVAGQPDNLCFDAGIHIICENVINAGLICCDQTICEGETPAAMFQTIAPVGGTGPFEYQWLQFVQIGSGAPTWVGVPGATGPTYQPGPLYETARYMRCVRRQGCVTYKESNIITITVIPAGTGGCGGFSTDFSVSPNGPTSVLVSWVTLPEAGDFMYDVLHSVDMQDWNIVSTVMGLHDPNQPNEYSYVHETPVNGQNFYRIRRLNAAGQEAHTDIRSITLSFEANQAVSIFPNPAGKSLTIKNVEKYEADVTVDLIATSGVVMHSMVIPQGTLQSTNIPVADFPAGLYIARIRFGNGEVRNVKFTKQ
jgi:hypothetical protein